MKSNSEQLTDPPILSATESHKAWHIFSLLVFIGKPTPVRYLASQCSLFPATSDLISSLCSIPNSPITLSSNKHFVATSSVGFSFLAAYLTRNFTIVDAFGLPPIRFGSSPEKWLSKRKRDEDVEDNELDRSLKRIRHYCTEVQYRRSDDISRIQDISNWSFLKNDFVINLWFLTNTSARQLSSKMKGIENVNSDMGVESFFKRIISKELAATDPDPESTIPTGEPDNKLEMEVFKTNPVHSPEREMQRNISVVGGNVSWDCTTSNFRIAGDEPIAEDSKEDKIGPSSQNQGVFHLSPLSNIDLNIAPPECYLKSIDENDCYYKIPTLGDTHLDALPDAGVVHSAPTKQPSERFVKAKTSHMDTVAPELQTPSRSLGHTEVVNTYARKMHGKRNHLSAHASQKSNQKIKNINAKDRGGKSTVISQDQPKPKIMPEFESYTVEDEEGSGGYGTVYRARSKTDGTLVAIKCPHANAHKHYVINEQKMLERFGGKNFVIRYQGSFKSADSDCFVLDYVEHDRPEVLKKDIGISQLQWYAYCLFQALANLHKQGVVHRDVKPGNFLFSRKTNKGYLIDFNLAMDLHQKYRSMEKSKLGYDVSSRLNYLSARTIDPANQSRILNSKSLERINIEATKGSTRLSLEPRNMKKTAGQGKAHHDMKSWNKINSQGADGSGITSAKDVSARTPSAERVREPLPCQGRKELISLLQEAMQSPNHGVSHVPAPMRKRVAASPGKMDRQVLHLSPMPLSPASLAKNKGDGKHKREGPCAGTKGFRAPEVLFRSQHQGPKIDIWSAGVTLLYLMIGKSPFVGDPEQNIKDIAKLRGSEDLWEVAKIHNRESSFPEDLYGKQSSTLMNLQEWCQMNSKRREFLQEIPSSLYDLVNKCLTVNPRLRITADDALKHEFFSSIHQKLRKHRTIKQALSIDLGTKKDSMATKTLNLI